MPELGKYAFAVLTSWGVTIALMAALVAWSVMQGRAAKRALDAAEARRKGE